MSEVMEYDVLIVGAGPAGLSTAIRLKQLNSNIRVCVLEKGAEVGAHTLSGAVFEPRSLNELLPDWQSLEAPLNVRVQHDEFLFLTEKRAFRLPIPSQLQNRGNYIIRMGFFIQWLARQAESQGVEIYPGFPAAEVLFDTNGAVRGIKTTSMGIDAKGEKTDQYQPGVEIIAKQTILAEGCRGSVTKQIMAHFDLGKEADPQTYGLGIKELWEVKSPLYTPGLVSHTVGWPLKSDTYGGTFIYHLANNLVAVGGVVGLDYPNPHLSPFQEFQRFKMHPRIHPLFENGRRLSYGARALNEGGFQSIPKLTFPGGAIVGCAAGFMNVPKIKGTHTAMKSGMLAAEATVEALDKGQAESNYDALLRNSWVYEELREVRNIRPSFQKGLWYGLMYSALDMYFLKGKSKGTLHHHADHKALKPAIQTLPITYPAPDNKVSFDILSSLYISNTNHRENQPCHLVLKDPEAALKINLALYDAPETRYCPANVYEIIRDGGEPRLQINSQNCLHCKTCDIKDPTQNITWVTPEGGGGPNYSGM